MLAQRGLAAPVAQRWQSKSLKGEKRADSDPDAEIERIKERAFSWSEPPHEFAWWDFEDEFRSNPAERLNAEELALFERASELQNHDRLLREELSHIIPRELLNAFYDRLDKSQQEFVGTLFGRVGPLPAGATSDGQADNRQNLLSIRSNLVLGPKGAKRADDPDHQTGRSGIALDPNFTAEGHRDDISKIHAQTFAKLQELHPSGNKLDPLAIEEIVGLLLDAELLHAERQGKDSFWKTRSTVGAWEKEKPDDPRSKWQKRGRPTTE